MADTIRITDGKDIYEAPAGTTIPQGYTEVQAPGVVNSINSGLGYLKGQTQGFLDKHLPGLASTGWTAPLNPVPGNLGEAGALGASALTGSLIRGAGVTPSLIRGVAPAAGGLAGDLVSGESAEDSTKNALLRSVWGLGAEGVAGVLGLVKSLHGAKKLQQGDLGRVAGTVTEASGGARPIKPTPEDIALAGESKPSMGNPRASSSLEAALDQNLKGTFKNAAGVVGEGMNFALPSGGQGSLKQALDEYANLRSAGTTQGAAVPGAGDSRAQAEGLWSQIMSRLLSSPDPSHRVAAGMLEGARDNHAKGMSAYRMIQDARTGSNVGGKTLPPIIDPKTGKLDMAAFQTRANALSDAGMIDPAVRDQLVRQGAQRGGRQPGQALTDIPGEFNPGAWLRFHGAELPGLGVHPHMVQFPKRVGPADALKSVGPVTGIPRALINLGSILAGQSAGRVPSGD